MKFAVDRDPFSAAAAWAASVIPSKTVHPALSCIQVTAAAGQITMTGTDYERTARVTIAADIDTPGSLLLPGRFFTQVMSSTPRHPVTVTQEDSLLRITCGPAKFAVPIVGCADEFPQMPDLPPLTADMTAAEFTDAVASLEAATSRATDLPQLTAIYLVFSGDAVTMVATDRFRIAEAIVPWTVTSDTGWGDITGALIPARSLAAFAKAAGAAGKISLAIGGTAESPLIGISDGVQTLVTGTLAGEFPAWRTHFETTRACTAVLDGDTLADAVKRCSIAADSDETPVRLEWADDQVTVSSSRSDGAAAAETIGDVTYNGVNGFRVMFKPRYLIDGITGCRAKMITLEMGAGTKSTAITAASSDGVAQPASEPQPWRYVVVPMRPPA